MPLHNFRSVHMPYCLKQQEDGSYVVLNREYKPLGFRTRARIQYQDYPICVKLKGMTPKLAAKLSYKNDPDTTQIFLYKEGSAPELSPQNMAEYLERLSLLASLEFEDRR